MITRSIEDVSKSLNYMLEHYVDYSDELVVTRQGKKSVVIMTEADLKSCFERIGSKYVPPQIHMSADNSHVEEMAALLDELVIEADDTTVKLIIDRENAEPAVMMTEDEYNNIEENLYLKRNPETWNKIVEGVRQLEDK